MKLLISLFTAGISAFLFFAKAEKEVYTSQDPLAESIERGAEIYIDFCIQCHLGKGEGVKGAFPPLAESDWLTEDRYKEAVKAVKYGLAGPITVNGDKYDGVMANLELYEDEVADVMNYIMNNWGNTQKKMITEEEVKAISK